MAERVQKVLAAAGYGSRRKVEEWIREGRLTINGRSAQLGDTLDGSEKVILDGRPLNIRGSRQPHRHIIYNKPGDEITILGAPARSGAPSLWTEQITRDGEGVEVVLYTPRMKRTFAHATGALDELGMTIVDARIVPTRNDYSLDSFVFMESDKRMEIDKARMNKIRRSLTRILTAGDDSVASVTRTASRQARVFNTKTSVHYGSDTPNGRTVLELVAADRPGLLSKVGQVFMSQGVDIENAKIMTIGERAEDVFYVSDEAGAPLDDDAKAQLRDELISNLDESK